MAAVDKYMFPGLILTWPLSWHGQASYSAIPIILSTKGESQYYQL